MKWQGPATWLDYRYTPVKHEVYQAIYEDLITRYIALFCAQSSDEIIYKVGVAGIGINTILAYAIFRSQCCAQLKADQYTHVAGQQAEPLAKFDWLSFPKQALQRYAFQPSNLRTYNFRRRLKNLYSLGQGLPSGKISSYLAIGSLSHPAQLFCQQTQRRLTYLNPYAHTRRSQESRLHNPSLSALIEQYHSDIIKTYQLVDSDIPWASFIQQSSHFAINQTHDFIVRNLTPLKQKIAQTNHTLVAAGLGYPLHRAFVSAWQLAGGEAIGFSHGNSYATAAFNRGYVDADGLSLVDRYYSGAPGEDQLLQELAKTCSRGLQMAEVAPLQSSPYREIFDCLPKHQTRSSVKSVMLLGFPMNQVLYPSMPNYHALSILRLEIGILKCLKANGFTTLYKAHPNRLTEIAGVMDSYVDEIITQPFEDSHQMADCVVFTHPYTSTFGYAMLTQTPLVLMNHTSVSWYPLAFDAVAKRCCMVQLETDDDDEFTFSDHELMGAIAASPHSVNHEVVYQYAF
ncbi:hypothetical protein [Leptolyngbya iicbica]|uniref:Uncharacterized protein n=2 Tax=Cyanophyceae TaxID=3028117 RepID=A0A4Q7EFH7_9CYAN|nr:hypothetical protein DYY88_05100 [Leptolyngbya sp. LK]